MVKQPTTKQRSLETVIVTVKNKVGYIHSALQRSYSQRVLATGSNRTAPSKDVHWLNLRFGLLSWNAIISKLMYLCCYEDEVERLSPCILLKASCCCLLRGLGGFLSPVEDKQENIFREKTSRNSPHIQSRMFLCSVNLWGRGMFKKTVRFSKIGHSVKLDVKCIHYKLFWSRSFEISFAYLHITKTD